MINTPIVLSQYLKSIYALSKKDKVREIYKFNFSLRFQSPAIMCP